MKKEELYIQTRLERVFSDKREEMISWIPAKIAVKGNVVRLKDNENGEWTEGWTVLSEPKSPMPYSILLKNSQDYKKTRKASDI